MTTEPTMNPETSADDIDVEMTMEEAMALEAAQRAAANPPAATPASDSVFKPLVVDSPSAAGNTRNDIDMILDIPVQLTVELGRTKVPIKNLLQLAQGSVVELDALAGEPMDVLVNGYLIAQGEVVVVNDGSVDRTGELLGRHFAGHPRVRIFTQPNRGKPAALSRAVAAEPDYRSAFERYERERHARTTWVTNQSRQIGAGGQIENQPLCAVRNFVIKILPSGILQSRINTAAGFDITGE